MDPLRIRDCIKVTLSMCIQGVQTIFLGLPKELITCAMLQIIIVMRFNASFMSADLVQSHALWSQEVWEEASLSSISRKLHQFLQATQWHFLRHLLRASQNPNLPKLKHHRNQCLQSQQLKKNQLQRLLLSRRKV